MNARGRGRSQRFAEAVRLKFLAGLTVIWLSGCEDCGGTPAEPEIFSFEHSLDPPALQLGVGETGEILVIWTGISTDQLPSVSAKLSVVPTSVAQLVDPPAFLGWQISATARKLETKLTVRCLAAGSATLSVAMETSFFQSLRARESSTDTAAITCTAAPPSGPCNASTLYDPDPFHVIFLRDSGAFMSRLTATNGCQTAAGEEFAGSPPTRRILLDTRGTASSRPDGMHALSDAGTPVNTNNILFSQNGKSGMAYLLSGTTANPTAGYFALSFNDQLEPTLGAMVFPYIGIPFVSDDGKVAFLKTYPDNDLRFRALPPDSPESYVAIQNFLSDPYFSVTDLSGDGKSALVSTTGSPSGSGDTDGVRDCYRVALTVPPTFTLVTRPASGFGGTGGAAQCEMSSNGAVVAFLGSTDWHADGASAPGAWHLYRHDVNADTLQLVGRDESGAPIAYANEYEKPFALSADGTTIAYKRLGGSGNEVFWYNPATGKGVPLKAAGGALPDGSVDSNLALSATGSVLIFGTTATNLGTVPGATAHSIQAARVTMP